PRRVGLPVSRPLLSCSRPPFLISGHGAHRALRSFPTRRSSDLVPGSCRPPQFGAAVHDLSMLRVAVPRLPGDPVGTCCSQRQCRDRKSTRLNSSHVKISYAVFCLKKKKQKNRMNPPAPPPPSSS